MSTRIKGKSYTTHTGVNVKEGVAYSGKQFLDKDGNLVVKSVSVLGTGATAIKIVDATGNVATGPGGV